MTARNRKLDRKHVRALEQLQQFYSPMLGMREELLAKKEASIKVNTVARDARKASGADESASSIIALRDYDHKQWWNELMPIYAKMLVHFTDHMWLAKESTRSHNGELTRFVELWRRYKSASLDDDVTF